MPYHDLQMDGAWRRSRDDGVTSATWPAGRECAAAQADAQGHRSWNPRCDRLDGLWTSRWLCFALRTACLDKHRNRFGSHRSRHAFDRITMEPGLVGAAGHRRIQPAARLAADANGNVPATNRTSCEPQAGRAEANFGVKDLTMLSLIKPLHLALDLHDACTQGDLATAADSTHFNRAAISSAHGNKKA